MSVPLDVATGSISFDDLDLVVRPQLDRPTFETHPDAGRFAPFVTNEPHRSYRGTATVAGTPFIVVLWFADDVLERASLIAADVGGDTWDDYDPAELRRFHDEWLGQHVDGPGEPWNPRDYPYGGVEHRFEWGTVGSYLHPQDQNATITLSYAR